ncbi:complement resistance protein TraT [Candidatus Deianiraea vastatrix]|uniref:TraT-like protein n=1 Tax=Candidatus Deianiraea vastatrix TaxID=2163644 RepID=A0A5B8XIN8_9RICK|nr:complement resistance protein TraT [Candidatus Deianiraea vastatrix]QED23841.1 Putative TraT-like protein [Candidatus Deianiraea vastatrix]
MIGGTLSFVSQNSTKPKIYIATVDIEIGQKVDNQVVYEEKYLHRQDDNGMRWHNIKSTDNKNYMRTKMYAVTKRTLLDIDSASSILVGKIGEAIGNSL